MNSWVLSLPLDLHQRFMVSIWRLLTGSEPGPVGVDRLGGEIVSHVASLQNPSYDGRVLSKAVLGLADRAGRSLQCLALLAGIGHAYHLSIWSHSARISFPRGSGANASTKSISASSASQWFISVSPVSAFTMP